MSGTGTGVGVFTDKYGQRLNEPVMLGYLAHLHLDARYVTEYWPTVMAFMAVLGNRNIGKPILRKWRSNGFRSVCR